MGGFLYAMNVSSRRYEPFHSSECQSYKRTTARTTQRKQSLFIKRSSNKSTQDKQRRKSFSPSKSSSKVGDYILTNVNISSRLCKAVNEITRKEYTCQYIEISKYRETLLPYTLVSPNENVNNIIEILYGKKYVYFIFEESFGDLHSYIRSKKKLKEHEACNLFQQIVNVVKHCHKVGVVIRDLKLRKFVFKDPSRYKLSLMFFFRFLEWYMNRFVSVVLMISITQMKFDLNDFFGEKRERIFFLYLPTKCHKQLIKFH